MADQRKLSTQERMMLFSQATRQNIQMLPQRQTTLGASTLQFSLPKARLLSKIWIDFEAKVKIKHASGTAPTTDMFTPGKLIRRLSLDLNNGFSPYTIGGKELMIYNAIRDNPAIIFPQSSNAAGYCYMPQLTASSAGTSNDIKFTVEMPVTLNDRDLIGLILLQSAETNVTLSIDLANGNDILDNAAGYTVDIELIKVTPAVETYSIPAVANAMPDLSVLKLVSSRTDAFTGSGQNVIKLATGTIYRKLAFYVTDDNGVPFADSDFQSPIELVFNQADVTYSVRAENLRHINESHFGYALPKGVYVFDFSYNGVSNYGGTRDLIDTELLTEFWVRFNSSKSGKISIINENIARLK